MCDLFNAPVLASLFRNVFEVMVDTPQHSFQVLTKRPRAAQMADRLPWPSDVWLGAPIEDRS